MSENDAWTGTVVRKRRALYDGANLYRRVKVEFADGSTAKVRVPRGLWKTIRPGDVLVKEPGADPVVRAH